MPTVAKFVKKTTVLISILVGLVVFQITNYISLAPPSTSEATQVAQSAPSPNGDGYWRGTVDQRLKQNDDRDIAFMAKLDNIDKKIGDICADITQVKVDAARNGALYGSASAVITFLIQMLIQTLARRNGRSK